MADKKDKKLKVYVIEADPAMRRNLEDEMARKGIGTAFSEEAGPAWPGSFTGSLANVLRRFSLLRQKRKSKES